MESKRAKQSTPVTEMSHHVMPVDKPRAIMKWAYYNNSVTTNYYQKYTHSTASIRSHIMLMYQIMQENKYFQSGTKYIESENTE